MIMMVVVAVERVRPQPGRVGNTDLDQIMQSHTPIQTDTKASCRAPIVATVRLVHDSKVRT